MAKYTAFYHVTFSVEIEAENLDDAKGQLENMTNDEIFEGVELGYTWPEFDYLMDEDDAVIFEALH